MYIRFIISFIIEWTLESISMDYNFRDKREMCIGASYSVETNKNKNSLLLQYFVHKNNGIFIIEDPET